MIAKIWVIGIALIAGIALMGCINLTPPEGCAKEGSNKIMSTKEAYDIANASDCVAEGALINGTESCNSNTGTWWINLDIQKEGCSPACVINTETNTAEINWRCTGLIEPTEQTCAKTGSTTSMTLTEAIDIANASDCVSQGTLVEGTEICNENSGTWWIDLNVQEDWAKVCSPACVINTETKTAEINGRCRGVGPLPE